MIDVGQGDSLLLHSNNESILIDTGGLMNSTESKIVSTTTIPLLKSLGIKKLKFLILTHGDADHMGEASFLLDNFKVETVIINQGTINALEEDLIKNYSNIYMSKQNQIITCGDITLQQLNTNLQDENDSSQVYYGTYKNFKMLFTGDASVKTEQAILSEYSLGQIDILKVGHHGSKTSSGKKFINLIKPKYSLISVGKDNKFGHPNKSVLEILKDSKIYRTDVDGSIEIRLNRNGYKISTCPP